MNPIKIKKNKQGQNEMKNFNNKNYIIIFSVLAFLSFTFSSLNSFTQADREWSKQYMSKLSNKNEIKAFLDLLAALEGTDFRTVFYHKANIVNSDRGYNVRFPSKTFSGYQSHPKTVLYAPVFGKMVGSSAAGRYQILKGTWASLEAILGLEDFTPENQDLGAIYLMYEKKVIKDIINEINFEDVISKLGSIWATMPGSQHNEYVATIDGAKKFYDGRLAYHKGIN